MHSLRKLTLVFVALKFLTLAAAAMTGIAFTQLSAMATPGSIAAFCNEHPNLDFPDKTYNRSERGNLAPAEVAAVGATRWRCMDGKVYVCNGGASGSACWKMDPSRTPTDLVKETCEDNPGQSFVAIAVIANSSSTWRCDGPTPQIVATIPLDANAFMKGTWVLLFDAQGKLNTNVKFGADPR